MKERNFQLIQNEWHPATHRGRRQRSAGHSAARFPAVLVPLAPPDRPFGGSWVPSRRARPTWLRWAATARADRSYNIVELTNDVVGLADALATSSLSSSATTGVRPSHGTRRSCTPNAHGQSSA